MPIPFSRLTLATSLSLFSLCGSAQEPIKTVLEEKLRGEAVLEKIIVTAQKRIQNIQSVPVSITAFDSQSLSSLGVLLASDIASQTPNLQASQPYGDAQPIFTLRGISMLDFNTNQSSPVGIYVDESPVEASFMQASQLFDIERAEVLRGPQGTLYGKNTTAGAINFISRAPDFEPNGNVYLSYGTNNYLRVAGAIETVLLEDELGLRVAFTNSDSSGFYDNHYPGADDLQEIKNWAIRASLRYKTDFLDATLRLQSGERSGNATGIIAEGRGPGGYDVAGFFSGGAIPQRIDQGYDAFEGSEDKVGTYTTKTDSVGLTVNASLSQSIDFTSVTAWSQGKALNQNGDGSPVSILEIDWGSEIKQWTQDLRLTSHFDGDFNAIVGLFVSKDKMEINNDLAFLLFTESLGVTFDPSLATSGFTVGQGYQQQRDSKAIYSHLTYAFSESLEGFLGLRYTQDKGELSNVNSWVGDYDFNFVYDLIVDQPSRYYNDNKFSGSLGLKYQLTNDLMFYGSYSQGYRSSAFNGGATFSVTELTVAAPETVEVYEIGMKSRWWDDRLQLNGALFHNNYKNQQLVNIVGAVRFLENAGSSSIAGAELELRALLSDDLSINFGLGLLETEYDELSLTNPVTSLPVDLSGNQLPSAPRLNMSLALDYVVASGEWGQALLHINSQYVSKQWYSAYNDDYGYDGIKADAYLQSNGRLTYSSADDSYHVSLWIKNIEENNEPIYAINAQQTFMYDYYIMPMPRQFGVDVNWQF
ncbi:MAG: TonB-dependent receptor [Colwellia sp.]|jgi:Outer membrane receptor proteins, mostly Fe transport